MGHNSAQFGRSHMADISHYISELTCVLSDINKDILIICLNCKANNIAALILEHKYEHTFAANLFRLFKVC